MKLLQLFQNPEPWIVELDSRAWYNDPIKDDNGQYHYIYCWVNLDTQWCYVGKHSSTYAFNEEYYLGSSTNPHYWNSRSYHEFKCLVLSYEDSSESAYLLESMIIDEYLINAYSDKGIFNLVKGGDNFANALRSGALKKYPETNGASPNFCKSGAEAHSQNSILRAINNYIKDLSDKGLEITPYNYYYNTYAGKSMWYQHVPNVLSRLSYLKSRQDWNEMMSFIFDHIIPNPDMSAKGSNRYLII